MIEPAAEVARRLKRAARVSGALQGASRFYAGWRFALTYGDPEIPEAEALVTRMLGEDFAKAHKARHPNDAKIVEAILADIWHLSASWRGGLPVEDARRARDELLVALGVPEDHRTGHEVACVFAPDGRPSPQVTHWIWRAQVEKR